MWILTVTFCVIILAAPSGNPEIWWISKTESVPEGGEEMGLIGKKFASGFKVRFFSKEDDGKINGTYFKVIFLLIDEIVP